MLDMGLSYMAFIILSYIPSMCFPGGSVIKNPPANARDAGSIPVSGSSPGEGNGNHSSILTWEIPWTEEPGGLPLHGVTRVRHNLVTKQQQQHSLYTYFVENFYHK